MQQQHEFEHTEHSTQEARQFNRDPREQAGWAERQNETFQADYRAPQQMSGQKIYPVRRRRRRWLWTLVIIVVILALLGGFAGLSNTVFSRTINLPQHTFSVSTEPQLVVKDEAGSVTFHTGADHVVSVRATEHIGLLSNSNDVQYTVEQKGNTIEVDVNSKGGSILSFGGVSLDITLPSISDIQATVNAGSLDVDGVSGLMNIQANAGSIDFKNGTIKGKSSFQSDAGSIAFAGELAPNGDYEFSANAGSINITLPSNSAFLLDASTNAGSVSNGFGSNTVGSNPTSRLHVHANAGSVSINQG